MKITIATTLALLFAAGTASGQVYGADGLGGLQRLEARTDPESFHPRSVGDCEAYFGTQRMRSQLRPSDRSRALRDCRIAVYAEQNQLEIAGQVDSER
jgi:hypothetical protein